MDEYNNYTQMHEQMVMAELEAEMAEGNALRSEAEALFEQMNHTDVEDLKTANEALLEKFTAYEDNLINYEIMNFLYAIQARVALNAFNFEKAFMYAYAGIQANAKQKDELGVTVNVKVMIDAAVLMGAFTSAIAIIYKHPSAGDPGVREYLSGMASKNDDIIDKLLSLKKRPKSLKFCLDEALCKEEKIIKSVMKSMGISRNEAMKYKKAAEAMVRDES